MAPISSPQSGKPNAYNTFTRAYFLTGVANLWSCLFPFLSSEISPEPQSIEPMGPPKKINPQNLNRETPDIHERCRITKKHERKGGTFKELNQFTFPTERSQPRNNKEAQRAIQVFWDKIRKSNPEKF